MQSFKFIYKILVLLMMVATVILYFMDKIATQTTIGSLAFYILILVIMSLKRKK